MRNHLHIPRGDPFSSHVGALLFSTRPALPSSRRRKHFVSIYSKYHGNNSTCIGGQRTASDVTTPHAKRMVRMPHAVRRCRVQAVAPAPTQCQPPPAPHSPSYMSLAMSLPAPVTCTPAQLHACTCEDTVSSRTIRHEVIWHACDLFLTPGKRILFGKTAP